MAGYASHARKNFLSFGSKRTKGIGAAQPLLIVARLHRDYLSDHPVMLGSAVFRAEEMISARLRRLEPRGGVASGNSFHLSAERRNIEAMQHILRDQRHAHRTSHRHVQLIDLALPAGMLKLPHPLLADSVHIKRTSWWPILLYKED